MTTTTTADTTRADAAAILRAVADLIETRPDIPVPGTDISFYVRGDDAPATMAAIAAALPCQWQAELSRGGEYEWLYLRSGRLSGAARHAGEHQRARRRRLHRGRGQDGHRLAARRRPDRVRRHRRAGGGGLRWARRTWPPWCWPCWCCAGWSPAT